MSPHKTIIGTLSMEPEPKINFRVSLCFLLFFLLASTSVSGQENRSNPRYLSVAYSGNNLWNPGARFAAEWLIPGKISSQESLNNENQWMLESHVGFFTDPGSHFASYAGVGLNYRILTQKNVRVNLSLHPARICRSFLPRTYQYEMDEARRIPLAGNNYYAPSAGLGFSKSLPKNKDNEIFTNIIVTVLLPYNTYVMPMLNLEAGWRFALNRKTE